MSSSLFLHVSLQDKILFTKNLALALKSGISLVNSLRLVRNQAKSRSFRRILDNLMADANKGMFLSDGLAKFKDVFGDLFINIIRVAETSGTLPENLVYLGEELAKRDALRKKVRAALIYPIVILVTSVLIGATMVVFVFPKILPLFQSAKVELPLTTRILITFSEVITDYGIFIFIGAVLAVVGFRFLLRLSPVKFLYDRAISYIPIFGRAVVHFNMANSARTLSLLIRSGVRITEAIDITAATVTNLRYRRHLKEAANSVRKGEFLSKYLYAYPHDFPTLLTNMIEVGENTGNLNENLIYLAEYYENEVDDFTKNLSSILEPILLIIMGGIVAFIALSFITPLYQLTRTIK